MARRVSRNKEAGAGQFLICLDFLTMRQVSGIHKGEFGWHVFPSQRFFEAFGYVVDNLQAFYIDR